MQRSKPNLKPTATLSASSSSLNPHDAIGRANSQTASFPCAGKKRQERMPDDVWSSCWSPPTLYPPAHLDDPKNGCLVGKTSGMSPNFSEQTDRRDVRKSLSDLTHPARMSSCIDSVLAAEATKAGIVRAMTHVLFRCLHL